jgi:hypothetical protein
MPTTATLLRFPTRLRFSAMHRFDAAHGRGAVVAVFFEVAFDHAQHRNAHQAQDQQQGREGEDGAQP